MPALSHGCSEMLLSDERIEQFIGAERLPDSFLSLAKRHYLPLAAWIRQRRQPGDTMTAGISGAQGTGKSTLVAFLQKALERAHGWRVAVLSLDDFYLTRAERRVLAERVHPLLATRGVPGTHDVGLLLDCIERLRQLGPGEEQAVPRFDKSADDRAAAAEWPLIRGPLDLVLLEGWCIGSRPQPAEALASPVNELELAEDRDGRWRHYVNGQLAGPYRRVFGLLDPLIVLQAPGFGAVRRWRCEQEHKLREAVSASAPGLMNQQQLDRFMQHYERLTRANLETLPTIADVVLELDDAHGCRRSYEVASGRSLPDCAGSPL